MIVNISVGPPEEAYTIVSDDSAASPTYVGKARSFQLTPLLIAVTSASKAAACVIVSTGHGLRSGNRVIVSDATEDWAGLNGSHVVTVIDDNSFSIPINTSAYEGDFDGAMTTRAPRLTAPVWSIQRQTIDSGITVVEWAEGMSDPLFKFSDRASLSYQ
jgi:hypothetical protein